jgi:manganese transport protein
MPKSPLMAPPSATGGGAFSTPRLAWLLGPALVAGVAYLDPGNVASNMTAGAQYGYLLVWVVVIGNTMAWLIQYLSAKLGVVTGRSLPEVLGERIRRPWARRAYWLQAELVAMATDVAEVIGGAVALYLLFGLPLVIGGLISGVASLLLLLLQSRGARMFELVIMGMLIVIAVGFSVGVFVAPPEPGAMLGGLVPRFEDAGSVLLAASILGATIMPHAIYAHSALARDRWAGIDRGAGAADARGTSSSSRHSLEHVPRRQPRAGSNGGLSVRRLMRATRWDVTIALVVAGSVNLAILLLAATNLSGVEGTDSLEGAYAAISGSLGPAIATLFAVGLLASGLASTSVGAYAGAEIMHGLLRLRIPLVARRVVTLIPAIAILALGLDPTMSLVLSQVVLSFGIPFALVPLVVVTARTGVLGTWRNHWVTTAAGAAASVFLIALNALLLWLVFTGA